eukprot:CAMPEP_0204826926 /NCGR_PEP_ID=MMETSP1346-20131115/4519_1 /ASSEMBLY_ACC=CAM_ASM_000771 /TAXON_ID=215587 /ORGANISM="Aplanochytrium stocchinoi, Strain GSBS06" /LENGTH=476 /DNA_ID=CAMNT_0051955165 /DNA_START=205 /DNA_END=1635 /DNA_ORIENTATION=-
MERFIERIVHHKSDPNEFVQVLNLFLETFKHVESCIPQVAGDKLLYLLLSSAPKKLEETVKSLLRGLDPEAAEKKDKGNLFLDQEKYGQVFAIKSEIKLIEKGFDAELLEIRKLLRRKDINYRTLRTGYSSVLEYLIELPKAIGVPRGWTTISTTQRVVRYTTPTVEHLLEKLARKREELVLTCNEAWEAVLESVSSKHHADFKILLEIVSTFDALLSLSVVAKFPGFVCPIVEKNDDSFLEFEDARHPVIEKLRNDIGSEFVPNSIQLGKKYKKNVQLITGPNMGGKSSYVRMSCVMVILAQIGSFVPATKCRVSLFDQIVTRMGASDDILRGMSTFLVEMRQTATMIENATPRSLLVLDEIGRGTSTTDGSSIARATLKYICTEIGCCCMFITHYLELAKLQEDFPQTLAISHMGFVESEEDENQIIFLYKSVPGPARKSYGLNVARLAGISSDIIAEAKTKSEELEQAMNTVR